MGHISISHHIKGCRRRDDLFEVFFDMILQFSGGPADVSLYFSKSRFTLCSLFQRAPPPVCTVSSPPSLLLGLIQVEMMYCCAVVASPAPDFSNCAGFKGDPAAFKSRARVSPSSCDQETSGDSYIQPSEVPLDGPPADPCLFHIPFHVWKAITSPAVFFVFFCETLPRKYTISFFEFFPLYLYIFISFQEIKSSCEVVCRGSSPRLRRALCGSSASTASKRKFRFWIREETALRHHRLPWFRLLLN